MTGIVCLTTFVSKHCRMGPLLFNLKKCQYYKTYLSPQLFSTLFISISGKEWMTVKRLFYYIRKQTLRLGPLLFNLKKCQYYKTYLSPQLFSTLFISISGKEWMTGKRLFDYIRKQTLPDGTTGRVAFDEMGDRIYAEYQVVNVQSSSKEKRVVVGHYKYSNVSTITYSQKLRIEIKLKLF